MTSRYEIPLLAKNLVAVNENSFRLHYIDNQDIQAKEDFFAGVAELKSHAIITFAALFGKLRLLKNKRCC